MSLFLSGQKPLQPFSFFFHQTNSLSASNSLALLPASFAPVVWTHTEMKISDEADVT